jgi:molybdopterin converting factor small subunit
MQVEVRLFATLREGRLGRQKIDLSEGSTVAQVLRRLGIDAREAPILLLNGQTARGDSPLKDGDTVSLFPLVAGG